MAKVTFRGYNKVAYTNNGSVSTGAIEYAPYTLQQAWKRASALGVCILRARQAKERSEITSGATFKGFHDGVFSFYIPKTNPIIEPYFKRKVDLGADNKGMQVMEVATNVDVQELNQALDRLDKHLNGGIFTRLFTAIRSVFA